MTNQYRQLKNKHEAETNQFPMAFAFSNEQFKEGMEKLGLTEHDTDKVLSIGLGGFIRKTDKEKYIELKESINKDMEKAIKDDTTGEGFILDMFEYELGNHEYGYTYDIEPTLDALSLTREEVEKSEALSHGLKLALKSIK